MALRLTVQAEDGTRTLTAGRRHTLTLELTVPSPPPAIVPGPAVPEDQAKTSGTPRLYLIFGTLLDAKALEALSVTAPGWEPKYFGDPTPSWVLAPRTGLTLTAGQTIAVAIANVVCRDAQEGQLIVDHYNFGVPDGSIGLPLSVRRGSKRDLDLAVRLVDPAAVVWVTRPGDAPIENAISLAITNPSATEPLAASGAQRTQDASRPSIRITCASGDPPGYGAVTTKASAAGIRLDEEVYATEYAGLWQTGVNTQVDPPYVELTALPGNLDVLGTGAASTLQLKLTRVFSELAPGVAPIYVEWRDIPGCLDGGTAVTIWKVGRTRIPTFTPNRTIVDFTKGAVPITFTYEAVQAVRLTLNGRAIGSSDLPRTFRSSMTVPVAEPSAFTLAAAGAGPDNVAQSQPVAILSLQKYLDGRTFASTYSGETGVYVRQLDVSARLEFTLTEQLVFAGDLATYTFQISGRAYPYDSGGMSRDGGPPPQPVQDSRIYKSRWQIVDGRVSVDAPREWTLLFDFVEKDFKGTLLLTTPNIVVARMGEFVIPVGPGRMTTL